MAFRVGQKVECVCITMKMGAPIVGIEYPKVGNIYTVSRYFTGNVGYPLITLYELDTRKFPDRGFDASYFRPLVTKKTDISIFEKMLLTTKEDA
jgi:hypothetical protein